MKKQLKITVFEALSLGMCHFFHSPVMLPYKLIAFPMLCAPICGSHVVVL